MPKPISGFVPNHKSHAWDRCAYYGCEEPKYIDGTMLRRWCYEHSIQYDVEIKKSGTAGVVLPFTQS